MKLTDILTILKDEPKKYKVHCATTGIDNKNPLHEFLKNNFENWQKTQTKTNFKREFILSLIYLNPNEWLFAGIYRSISYIKKNNLFYYETELVDYKKDLIGRLIVQFEKKFRTSYLLLENHIDNLYLSEIKKDKITIQVFPGYENVLLDFNYLKLIIEKEESTWKTALQITKGIYLISDKTTGKLYVGSVSGNDAFWSRWKEYCNNGHGGNARIKELINKIGYSYTQYFQISILETLPKTAKTNEIIQRENHWKRVLLTRDFGYNDN